MVATSTEASGPGTELGTALAALVDTARALAAWVVVRAPAAWEGTTKACAGAVEKARYAWALLVATYRVSVVQRHMASQDSLVYKVCALNEDTGEDATVTRGFDPRSWEPSVRAATGWGTANLRVDVRYLAHGRKYRLVLRPGQACSFPLAPERHRGGPKGVMAAELVGNDVSVNITRRVHKYEGPAKDFHGGVGLHVGVTDMFPMDDPEELHHNFHTLRIVDAHARLLTIPTTCDDVASALALSAAIPTTCKKVV